MMPPTEQEVIDYAAIIGETEDTALLFYYHYEAVGWSYTTPAGIEVPYRKWEPLFNKWRVQGRTFRAQAERVFAEKIAFWKQNQNRRDAERAAERLQRAKEHNPTARGAVASKTIDGNEYYPYAWYMEQVNTYGAKVNDRLEMVKDENGKPWWRYKQ